jgi:uncharacterized protein (DUF924 family)
MSHDADTVLTFWFGELTDGLAAGTHRRRWFESNAARDERIRDEFGPLLVRAADGKLASWRDTPRSSLALIIICDQFARQIHRGTAAAYATDPLALEIAHEMVASGDDLSLALDERVFVYMPFEHSESRTDQHTSVGLFTALRDATPAAGRRLTGAFVGHARQHRDIVLRFGRFPHRNALLDRVSTPAEQEFLKSAGDFGQTPGAR